jgi:GTPase SAR1 family protein
LVENSFFSIPTPTLSKQEYFPSLVFETSILECRLVDLPAINELKMNGRTTGAMDYVVQMLPCWSMITTPSSFRLLQNIRDQIDMSRGLSEVPIVVVANKVDLVKFELTKEGDKEISRISQDISGKVKKCWKLSHIECSAKHNWNVNIVFRELAKEIMAARNGRNGIHGNKEQDQCCLVCV